MLVWLKYSPYMYICRRRLVKKAFKFTLVDGSLHLLTDESNVKHVVCVDDVKEMVEKYHTDQCGLGMNSIYATVRNSSNYLYYCIILK